MSTIGGTKMYSSNGLSGLVSGMNTESMVEALLSGTQSKIDTQYAKKQQLEWKQEIYRDIISDLRTFQTKFFSYSNPASNLLSNSFFNSLSADFGSSSAINVTASSNAVTGKTTIDKIIELASATKKTSGSEISGKIAGTLVPEKLKFNEEIALKIGDVEKTINLDSAKIFTSDDLVNEINTAWGSDVAALKNGKLTITAPGGEGTPISISGSKEGLAVLGLNGKTSVKGELSAMHDLSKMVPSLTINMDGVEKTIYLDFPIGSIDEIKSGLNDKIEKTFGTGLKVEFNGADMEFKAEGGRHVTMVGGSALEAFQIEKGASNKVSLYAKLKDVSFAQGLSGETFVFKINGVTFAASGEESLKNIMDRVNNSDAGVTMSYSSSQDKFVIESKTTGEGVDIEMSQSTGNLLTVLFGTKPSGSVASGQLKKDSITGATASTFADVPSGDFSLIMNGTEIKINLPEKTDASGNPENYTEEQALEEINRQLGERIVGGTVKLVKDTATNKVVIETSPECNVSLPATVDADSIAGKLGFEADQTTKADASTTLSDLGLSGNITVGGNPINLDGIATVGDLVTEINGKLGSGTCTFDEASGILRIDGVATGTAISGTDTSGSSSIEKLFGSSTVTLGGTSELVLSSGDSAVTSGKKMSDLGLSGSLTINVNGTDKTINLAADKTVTELADELSTAIGTVGSVKFDDSKGGFVICGVTIPVTFEGADEDGNAAMDKLFGSQKLDIANDGTLLANRGTNAKLSVNGKEIEKNTNTFTMDGLDFELKETTDQAITINTSKNTEQISKGIEEFVKEYNTLIEKLNGLVHEDSDYKEYPPLTDAQRSEMTEDQIKLWEEKAKTGLVRNDSHVNGILQEMRNILYQKPAGCDIALYDLGIETSKDFKDYGKLVIKDPAKLKNMIETKSEDIQKLFTSETDGLSVKINKALDNTAKASSASPGSLVELAGIKGGSLDKNSLIDKRIDDVDKSLKSLKIKYEMEKTRYWKQFNAMEKMIQQMNQQSSWLMQQFA